MHFNGGLSTGLYWMMLLSIFAVEVSFVMLWRVFYFGNKLQKTVALILHVSIVLAEVRRGGNSKKVG